MVANGYFAGLKSIFLRWFEAERSFKNCREELLVADRKGYDFYFVMRRQGIMLERERSGSGKGEVGMIRCKVFEVWTLSWRAWRSLSIV